MNLQNYYWVFPGALSNYTCDHIIRYGKEQKKQLAVTGNIGRNRNLTNNPLTKKEHRSLKKQRDSTVAWINDPWIYQHIHPFLKMANQDAGWNFQWDWSEPIQFTYYTKKQYYGWHCDSWENPYGTDSNFSGKIRKLSLIASLSSPTKYKGGELEFDFKNRHKTKPQICEPVRERGSIVVFPSFVWHRVKPVTRGERYSLVCWHLGAPFI